MLKTTYFMKDFSFMIRKLPMDPSEPSFLFSIILFSFCYLLCIFISLLLLWWLI